MKINRFMAAAVLLLATVGIARAERNPTPPPSGIVVHLFGPNGVLSNVVPSLPGETPSHPAQSQSPGEAPSHATQGQSQSAGPATNGATAANGTASVDTSEDPSWHAILHQLFITGDPNDPPKRASGRPGERQNTLRAN